MLDTWLATESPLHSSVMISLINLINPFSHLDHVPLPLQLGVLLHHPPQERCPQERLRMKMIITIHPYLASNIFAKECKRCHKGSAKLQRLHSHFVPQSGTSACAGQKSAFARIPLFNSIREFKTIKMSRICSMLSSLSKVFLLYYIINI